MSRTGHHKLVRLADLQPHPENESIYRDSERTTEENDELLTSICNHGLWEGQLQVHAQSMTILHGHRRVAMALELGIEEAVVTIRTDLPEDPTDPEVIQFLLNGNAQREKTHIEKLREFEVRKAVEKELAKRRKDANLTQNHRAGAPHRIGETGDSRDIAARKAGLGNGSTAEKALQALHKADAIAEEAPEKAKAIKAALNQSLSTGIRTAKQLTAEKPAVVKPAPPAAINDQPQATMTLVDSSAKLAKASNVMDGKRHRSLKRCREMPGFRDELAYLQKELPKLHRYLQTAEAKLRAIGDHFRDEYVKDRYNADFMTVWARGWADDGALDYLKELESIQGAISLMQGAYTGLVRFTQTDEIMIDLELAIKRRQTGGVINPSLHNVMTIRKSNGRKLLQLSMRPDFYEQIRLHCQQLDMPVTVWARELIKRELASSHNSQSPLHENHHCDSN